MHEDIEQTTKILALSEPLLLVQTDLKAMRTDIVLDARTLSARALIESRRNRNLHLTWTVSGLTLGLGFTSAAILVNPDNNKQKVAQIGTAVGTFVAGVLAVHSFDANRKKLDSCAADVVRLAGKFEIKWGDQLGMKDIDEAIASATASPTDEKAKTRLADLRQAFSDDAQAIIASAACQPSQ